MPSLQQTLDQQRAMQAWHDIQSVACNHENSRDFKKKYGSLARRVPMLVLTNGLAQTLAFLASKAKFKEEKRGSDAQANGEVFSHLSSWTMSQVAPNDSKQSLLDWIINNDSPAYRRATAEALAYLSWLKRFAEAELPTEEE